MPYQVTRLSILVSDWLGILNTKWAILLPGAFAPFSVFLLTKFMRRIPVSTDRIGQAGRRGRVANLLAHLSATAVPRGAIPSPFWSLSTIGTWSSSRSFSCRDASQQPLSVYLSQISVGEIGIAFAAAVVYMIGSAAVPARRGVSRRGIAYSVLSRLTATRERIFTMEETKVSKQEWVKTAAIIFLAILLVRLLLQHDHRRRSPVAAQQSRAARSTPRSRLRHGRREQGL